MAKFLIMTETRDHPQISPEAHAASHRSSGAFMAKGQEHGFVDAVYHILPNKGLAIVNAKSHEDLYNMLAQYPGFHAVNMTIHPLVDAKHAFSNPIQMPAELAEEFGVKVR
jgi:hypothetical protein